MDDICRIDAVLDRLGLGTLDWAAAVEVNGRNDNWLGSTLGGHRVFVKTIVGSDVEVAHGLQRTEAFYQARAESAPQRALRTTALLGQDSQAAVQVFESIDGARSGQQVARDNAFDNALAAKAGAAIGALHAIAPAKLVALERSLPTLPQQNLFRGLTMDMFYESSQAQLEAWRLLQQDPVIAHSLGPLEHGSADQERVPIHGDLRLDQFLVAEDQLYLADWEAFQFADPARDIGSFVGEWLHHAVTRFLADRANNSSRRPVPVPNIALTPSWGPWRAVRPVVEEFWRAYRTAQPNISTGLASRATVFACSHLLERLFIDALPRPRLDGSGHALFRLVRTILLSPNRFVPVLGLGE